MFPSGTYHAEQRRMWRSSSSFRRLVKRGFDIAVSAAGLLLLSPIILLISLVILIDSPWSVLCRHKRYNSENAEFHIFKFRTTIANSQEKTLNDSLHEMQRMTRFARILCRSGIDEIPLLMNVLQGKMSIVGSHMFTTAPGNATPPLSLGDVKPGLIAWTHPHDDNDVADIDKSIRYRTDCDRHYVENYSIFFDMKIIFHTITSKIWL